MNPATPLTAEFANTTADLLCHFENTAVEAGEDGWAMIAPFGDYPGMATITNEDGTLKRVPAIQRLDRQAAETMVRNFKSLWGRVKRYVTGAPIYLGHPDGVGVGHRYADKEPKGMFSDLEVRERGLYGRPVFTNEGLALLEKYRALSGRWTATEIGEERGKKLFRPDVFKSAGLTNQPNLPVELLNEFEAGQDPNRTMKLTPELIALFKKLGVELTNESTPEQIAAAVEARVKTAADLANEKAALETQVASEKETVKAKDATLTQITAERDALKTDFANERDSRITLLLDNALADGRITPATKPAWGAKLKVVANFANESEALGKLTPAVKTTAATAGLGARKAEIANAQERREKVTELVNEAMKTGLDYDAAFKKVQREHKELFAAMQQPASATK